MQCGGCELKAMSHWADGMPHQSQLQLAWYIFFWALPLTQVNAWSITKPFSPAIVLSLLENFLIPVLLLLNFPSLCASTY